MITGIETLNQGLQQAVLSFIGHTMDLSYDIEVEEIEDYIIKIGDLKFYVITDAEQQKKIAEYNKEEFDYFFDNLSEDQLKYIDEDLWEEENGISTFAEWLENETPYTIDDSDYYRSYNFYEIH